VSFDTDDIPVPQPLLAVTIPSLTSKQDTFDYPVALKLAFVGLGQCGGRIAEAFQKLGYGRAVAINTTSTDLHKLGLPPECKLDLQVGGAAKNLEAAAAAARSHCEDIRSLLETQFGDPTPEWTFLCFGMGGGTGAGTAPVVDDVVRQYLARAGTLGRESRIGAIVALPKSDEGPKPAENTRQVLKWLRQSGLAPIIVLDNQRIIELYRPSLASEYSTGNSAIAKLLHTLNRLAAENSDHTTFDKADLSYVLHGGMAAIGSQVITDYSSGTAISSALRDSMQSTLLADVDLSTATRAALIFVCGPEAYEKTSAKDLEAAYAMLGRQAPQAEIFRGIYASTKEGMTAVYVVSGLAGPIEKPHPV